jgi:methyl-accepting chemotaxis protein
MKWSDLSLSKKLMVPIALVGALLLLLSVSQITTMERLSQEFAHINEQYIPSIDLVLNADRDLYQAQMAERSIALGMPVADYQSMHDSNLSQVKRRVVSILDADVSAEAHSLASKFLKEFEVWSPKSKKLVSDIDMGSLDINSAGLKSTGVLDKEFESMRDTLDALGELLAQEAKTLQENAKDIKQEAVTKSLILVVIALLITLSVAIYFPRLIVGPITELTAVLNQLASGKGDLTKRMPRMGQDEIGKLAFSFNRFMSGMRTLIENIQGVAKEVHDASETLKSGAMKSESISQGYASSMELVSTANHEMGLAIQEVSKNTQQVSEEAKLSNDISIQVSSEFKKAMTEIQELAENVNNSGQVIEELVEETTNIASVLDVIKGIAEQTNLLALNAAIEAARAGEQGRGFAVVADEVRTLASKTQQSTGDINNMIENLRGGVNKAVESMKQGQEKANRTVEYAQTSENSIQQISTSLTSITDRIHQVASAIEEQTSVIDEINENLNGVKDLSDSGMDSAKEIGQSVEGLNQQASNLNSQTSSFKVS